MKSINVYPVRAVVGSKASDDGATVDLVCEWLEDGERFILRMPLHAATAAQIALQDAASDAALRGGNKAAPPIAEALVLQASPIAGTDILTLRVEGGMQLQFLLPARRYEAGIPRAPDTFRPSSPGQDADV